MRPDALAALMAAAFDPARGNIVVPMKGGRRGNPILWPRAFFEEMRQVQGDVGVLANGLFWQYDVRDGMEESISGSRTKKNVRPPLNSYMFGNARAVAAIARLAGCQKEGKTTQKDQPVLHNAPLV